MIKVTISTPKLIKHDEKRIGGNKMRNVPRVSPSRPFHTRRTYRGLSKYCNTRKKDQVRGKSSGIGRVGNITLPANHDPYRW